MGRKLACYLIVGYLLDKLKLGNITHSVPMQPLLMFPGGEFLIYSDTPCVLFLGMHRSDVMYVITILSIHFLIAVCFSAPESSL